MEWKERRKEICGNGGGKMKERLRIITEERKNERKEEGEKRKIRSRRWKKRKDDGKEINEEGNN